MKKSPSKKEGKEGDTGVNSKMYNFNIYDIYLVHTIAKENALA